MVLKMGLNIVQNCYYFFRKYLNLLIFNATRECLSSAFCVYGPAYFMVLESAKKKRKEKKKHKQTFETLFKHGI